MESPHKPQKPTMCVCVCVCVCLINLRNTETDHTTRMLHYLFNLD